VWPGELKHRPRASLRVSFILRIGIPVAHIEKRQNRPAHMSPTILIASKITYHPKYFCIA
jgi:hypothetical protein